MKALDALKALMSTLTPELFSGRFGDLFTETAFRLELLDSYVAANETEPYRRFLLGEDPDRAWREPWKRFVRQGLRAGRSMARVHVVTEPLTDYARFELSCVYPANVEAGEDVRILPRTAAVRLDLPDRDYWLFDSRRAGVMTYDSAGNWLSVDLTDDPDVIARLCRGRDVAMAHALPLTEYLLARSTKETAHARRAS